MVKSQACSALPLVPGLNVSRLESARTIVSCTRSSARSAFLQSEIANLRRRGLAATISFFIFISYECAVRNHRSQQGTIAVIILRVESTITWLQDDCPND